MAKRKTWAEKLASGDPHVAVLDKPYAGAPSGAKLFIASPLMVRDYMRAIPRGETRDVAEMRIAFAKQAKADATCPTSTGIFLRIAVEAALDEMAAGQTPADVTPFWRLVSPDSPTAQKLSCGPDFLLTQRGLEARSGKP